MFAILVIFVAFSFCFGQNRVSILDDLKDRVEIIDGYIEFEKFYLDPEEFLEKSADHGSELEGYYEHDRLKKIVRKVGTRRADLLTTFYFWNDNLIHVNYQQNSYVEAVDEFGERILDYLNTQTQYESKYYYNNDKLISKRIIGKPLKNEEPETKFLDYSKKMKYLLDNKFYNKEMYEALQGKWVFISNSDDFIKFEGTMRFNFYNKKYVSRVKTRIEDEVLVYWFPGDDKLYRYRIESLEDGILTLVDLSSQERFIYTKFED